MRYTGLITWAALVSSTLAKPGSYDSNSYGGNSGSYDSNSYGSNSGSYGSNSYGGNSGSDNNNSPSYNKGYGSNWNGGLKWDKTKSSWVKATQTILGQNSTVTQTQIQTEAFTATEVSIQAVTSTAVSTMLVTQTENGVASTLIIIVNISDGLPAATSVIQSAAATTTTAEIFTPATALPPTTFAAITQATTAAAAAAANTSIALQLNATAPAGPAVFTGSAGQVSVDYALTAAGLFALAAFLV